MLNNCNQCEKREVWTDITYPKTNYTNTFSTLLKITYHVMKLGSSFHDNIHTS